MLQAIEHQLFVGPEKVGGGFRIMKLPVSRFWKRLGEEDMPSVELGEVAGGLKTMRSLVGLFGRHLV